MGMGRDANVPGAAVWARHLEGVQLAATDAAARGVNGNAEDLGRFSEREPVGARYLGKASACRQRRDT